MSRNISSLWARHDREFRDPRQVVAQWEDAAVVKPALLAARISGKWWETLGRLGITLLVTREYEHLVMALGAGRKGPRTSCLRLPHPSGVAVDRGSGEVWLASTRLPNQLYGFRPVTGLMARADRPGLAPAGHPLVPVISRFLPGCLYLHDLAFVGSRLYGNAVGMNSVVRLDVPGPVRPAWWPRSVDRSGGPDARRNYLQLNSIAAGPTLRASFFSASAEAPVTTYPGDPAFPVDRRGVVFSGATRGVVARGLTRPHSARLFRGRVWVDNSGYGELGYAGDGRFRPVLRFPGWTRGLCFCRGTAFVGVSRVIPRFRVYAPGLDADRSSCGVHAVDMATGRVLGSITWPAGNQVFGLDWMPARMSEGFPASGKRDDGAVRPLYYSFKTR